MTTKVKINIFKVARQNIMLSVTFDALSVHITVAYEITSIGLFVFIGLSFLAKNSHIFNACKRYFILLRSSFIMISLNLLFKEERFDFVRKTRYNFYALSDEGKLEWIKKALERDKKYQVF